MGVATAYSIINRLDRLMVATKEIVGEQYHIHGVGVTAWAGGPVGYPLSPSVSHSHHGGRPFKDV